MWFEHYTACTASRFGYWVAVLGVPGFQETTIVFGGYMRIMENDMETTVVCNWY